MKYRILPTKSKTTPWKLIKDPDGENKTIGSYKTKGKAIEEMGKEIKGENNGL